MYHYKVKWTQIDHNKVTFWIVFEKAIFFTENLATPFSHGYLVELKRKKMFRKMCLLLRWHPRYL